MMKICLVADTLLSGGAEWFILRKYNALVDAGHQVTLVVLRADKIDSRIVSNFPGVKIIHAPVSLIKAAVFFDRVGNKLLGKSFLYNQYSAVWLAKKLNQLKPDVIHSHLLAADRITVTANEQLHAKHVITIHGDYIEHIKKNEEPFLPAINKVLKTVDAVVVISDEQKNILVSHYPFIEQKITKIYNGYTSEKIVAEHDADTNHFTFGLIARGIAEKGWLYAIEAFKQIERSDVKLLLYGEGAFLEELREKTQDDRIVFAGFTNKPLDVIKEFDVGLFPSYHPSESLPTTIIEYLVLHKPVLTTDVGECVAMIRYENQLAGAIIPMKDGRPDVAVLAQQMQDLLNNRDLYKEKAGIAALAKHKFAMEVSMERYLTVYKN